jgi:hypothetical protein
MVKTRLALIGTVLAFSILFSAIPMAAATTYYPSLIIKKDGKKWVFSTIDLFGNKMFSGKDVDVNTVEAYYWAFDETGELVKYSIEIKKIHLKDKKVVLTFDKKDLPESAEATVVVGALKNGVDTFEASGPGFVWRKWG